MKLYVKGITREPNDTLYTFLSKVLNIERNDFRKGIVNTTYLDPEFKELQCIFGKYRSFDDLVLISKTYFKVSDKVIARCIKKILDNDDDFILVLCNSAKKWVLNRNLNKSEILKYCAKHYKSDYKTDVYKEGEYSFDDIINLMGLSKEDIKIGNG